MKKNAAKRTIRSLRNLLLRSIPLFTVLSMVSCSLLQVSLDPFSGSNSSSDQAPEILIPVTRGRIASSKYFVGNLQYSQSASLNWKTDGVIDAVNVKVGDRVNKGDILAVLATDSLSSSVIIAEQTMIEQQEKLEDIENSELARMQAYSELNARESDLITAKLDQEALYYPRATRDEMERAWDTLALAHLNFNYAKQDYDYLVSIGEPWTGREKEINIRRFGRTFRVSGADERSGRERKFEEYVSAYNTYVSAYEDYKWISGEPSAVDYAVAEGNVRVAQMEYDKALEEYMSYEVMPREKDVNAAEISLNNAKSTYNQRFIVAQFDGTVTSVSAIKDYYVTKGSAAMRVDDMSRIFIPLSIPELDFNSVASGTEVTITVDAIQGKTFSGHLYTIADSSEVDGNTTAFSAMVEIDDPDETMLAGMTAEIAIPVSEKSDALLIPNSALTYIDNVPYVTIVSGDIRQTIEVQLGIVQDSYSEVISSTLKEGTKLAVSGITRDTLLQLGLDPAEYLESFDESSLPMMPDRPLPAGGSMPDMQRPNFSNPPASVPTREPAEDVMQNGPTVTPDDEPADSSAETSPIPDVSEGQADPEVTDGEMPQRPMGAPPFPDGNGSFPGWPNGQFPGGPPNGEMPRPPEGESPRRDENQPVSDGPAGRGPRSGEDRQIPTDPAPAEKG